MTVEFDCHFALIFVMPKSIQMNLSSQIQNDITNLKSIWPQHWKTALRGSSFSRRKAEVKLILWAKMHFLAKLHYTFTIERRLKLRSNLFHFVMSFWILVSFHKKCNILVLLGNDSGIWLSFCPHFCDVGVIPNDFGITKMRAKWQSNSTVIWRSFLDLRILLIDCDVLFTRSCAPPAAVGRNAEHFFAIHAISQHCLQA